MDANWPRRSLGFRVYWTQYRISDGTGGSSEADIDEDVSVASLLKAS
jgi:hypothetical protein